MILAFKDHTFPKIKNSFEYANTKEVLDHEVTNFPILMELMSMHAGTFFKHRQTPTICQQDTVSSRNMASFVLMPPSNLANMIHGRYD